MAPTMKREQEQLWDTVKILSSIDKGKAEVVLRTTIEKSLQLMNVYTPIVSTLHFFIPDDRDLTRLKELDVQINNQIVEKRSEKTYAQVLDYIDLVSKITDEPVETSRKLLASILAEKANMERGSLMKKNSIQPIATLENGETQYCKPNEVARKLGLSDQTIRRMCENGKFKGAFQTDGGHWRIPEKNFITTREQDQKAKEILEQIDNKNKEAGDVDEFTL